MKNTLKTLLALLLAAVFVFAVAACNGSSEDETTTTTTTTKLKTPTDNNDKPNTDDKDEGNKDEGNKDEGNTDEGNTDEDAEIELVAGDEKAAQTTEMGNLVYWNDQNWCGSTVTVTDATYDSNGYTVAFTHTGACWYGFQMFYNPVGAVNGDSYDVSFVIKSDVDTSITVCGTVYTLKANEAQTITYEVTLNMIPEATDYIYGQSAVSIQFGVEATETDIVDGTYVISDLVATKK